ncbi:DoxX family protein [Poseidonibacter ostreae]|nr:DoxX family protein [Poseidonibacter ostreae]
MYKIVEEKLSSLLNEDIGKLILRVSISVLMLFHGYTKLVHGVDKIAAGLVKSGLPEFLAYGVYIGEVLLPVLIILGLFTRLAALGMCITMVFAIYLVFWEKLFLLTKNGAPVIELPLLYLILSIVIFFIGAGKYSFDGKRNK